jgi:hypothetical protein
MPARMTEAQLKGLGVLPPSKPSKYRNKPVTVDGIRFASKREAKRWGELRLFERNRDLMDLQRQVRFRLVVNGIHIADYVADFTYRLGLGKDPCVEDCKGFRTREYKIKKRLMKACYGIDILET